MRRHNVFIASFVLLSGCGYTPRRTAPRPPVRPTVALVTSPVSAPGNFHYTIRQLKSVGNLPPTLNATIEVGRALESGRSSEGYAWDRGRLTNVPVPPGAKILRVASSGKVLSREGGRFVWRSAVGSRPAGPEVAGAELWGGVIANGAGAAVTQAPSAVIRTTGQRRIPVPHAFLLMGQRRLDIGALAPNAASLPADINSASVVVGTSGSKGFLWANGTMDDLGVIPGFGATQPVMISETGSVLGECTADEDTGYALLGAARVQPFLWERGAMTALPAPPGSQMVFPVGIADDGTAVGYRFSRSEPPMPLLWRDGKVYDLNTLVPRQGGWIIWKPLAISPSGEILALAQGATQNPVPIQPGVILLSPAAGPPGEAAAPVVVDGSGRLVPIPGRGALRAVSARPSPPAPVRYEIVQVSDSQVGAPVSFNHHGQIAGSSLSFDNGFFFIDRDGRHENLGTANGVLDVCQVTQSGAVVLRGKGHAVVWKNWKVRLVPEAGYSPVRMNARGDIVIVEGPSWIHGGKQMPLFAPGAASLKSAGPPRRERDGVRSYAYDINDKGQIVGTAGGRAVLWQNGKPRDLGVLPGFTSGAAKAINNAGQIAGVSRKPADLGYATLIDGYAQPFLWQNGKMRQLETLPNCPHVSIIGMNAHGEIIGTDRGSNGGTLIVWLNGHPYDIARLASGDIAWHLDSLQDINDRGEILALGQPQADVGVKGVERYLLLLKPKPAGRP